jgi:hypothetical protein
MYPLQHTGRLQFSFDSRLDQFRRVAAIDGALEVFAQLILILLVLGS